MGSVYWVGQDGNIYLKDSSGTRNVGAANGTGLAMGQKNNYGLQAGGFESNSLGQSVQAQRIADPNPGNPSSVVQSGATYSAPKPVYAPKLDIAGLNAQARSAAENAVNPYYTKALNDYLEKEAFAKQQQQSQTDTNIKNLEDTLTQTLGQNATTKERTAQDVATNQGQIARTEDQFQTDSGQQFDAARIAEARRAAIAGTTGGTAGANQESIQNKNATTESRQEQTFQDQKDQQELFKGRTFEDIATSNANATTSKEKGVTQANFDLDSFIKNQALEEKATRNDLEKSRLESVQSNAQAQSALLFSNWLSGISDPAKYLAAVQTYGSLF